MFQGVGEQVAQECNVSYVEEFFLFSVTVRVEVSLGTKLALLRESVRVHTDLILLHSCTFASFVTVLLCALHHSSNAFVLVQDSPQNRLPFDTPSLLFSLPFLSPFRFFFFSLSPLFSLRGVYDDVVNDRVG